MGGPIHAVVTISRANEISKKELPIGIGAQFK
jgi:hypothetical protein